MKFENLKHSKHFERDCLEDTETYIPIPNIECGWDGGDFPVYSISRNDGEKIVVAELDGDEQGGYVTFDPDADLKLYVYGIIEEL